MATILRSLKSLILIILAILSLLVTVTLIINLDIFDEELTPEVVALLKPQDFPPDHENGYVYFMGIFTAEDKDPQKVGEQYAHLMAEYIENDEVDISAFEQQHFPKEMANAISGSQFVTNAYRCEPSLDQSCLGQYANYYTDGYESNGLLKELLNRYQTLIQSKTFITKPKLDFKLPWPAFRPALNLSNLHLATSYQQSISSFIVALENDMKFWRMVSRDTTMLIAKLVAAAQLENHAYLISLLLNEKQLDKAQLESISSLLKPFTMDETSISKALIGEFSLGAEYLLTVTDEDLALFVTQRNATVNLTYQYVFLPFLNAAELSIAAFNEEFVKCKEKMRCFYSNTKESSFSLYNIYGRMLVLQPVPNYEDYINSVHQISVYLDLVRLQYEIITHLNQSPESIVLQSAIRNPMTGQPMDIDINKRTISYPCIDKSVKCSVNY